MLHIVLFCMFCSILPPSPCQNPFCSRRLEASGELGCKEVQQGRSTCDDLQRCCYIYKQSLGVRGCMNASENARLITNAELESPARLARCAKSLF